METNNKELVTIPLVCKENSDTKYLKIIKWLVILVIVMNVAWATICGIYLLAPLETTTETSTITQESDGDGTNNYIGEDGDIGRESETDSSKDY